MCKKKKKPIKSNKLEIIARSNIIQYDEMGYPLRLCIVKQPGKEHSDQLWLDTSVQQGDIEIRWFWDNYE